MLDYSALALKLPLTADQAPLWEAYNVEHLIFVTLSRWDDLPLLSGADLDKRRRRKATQQARDHAVIRMAALRIELLQMEVQKGERPPIVDKPIRPVGAIRVDALPLQEDRMALENVIAPEPVRGAQAARNRTARLSRARDLVSEDAMVSLDYCARLWGVSKARFVSIRDNVSRFPAPHKAERGRFLYPAKRAVEALYDYDLNGDPVFGKALPQ